MKSIQTQSTLILHTGVLRLQHMVIMRITYEIRIAVSKSAGISRKKGNEKGAQAPEYLVM